MQGSRLPKVMDRFFAKEHLTCWFSSRELLLSWDKKKKRVTLTAAAGFSGGQIHDFDLAVATLSQVCQQEGIRIGEPMTRSAATVFVSATSSPLERSLIRRVFQKAGFRKVSLVSYATALRSFAERQALHTGVGIYVGNDVSEGLVFSPENQVISLFHYSLLDTQQDVTKFLRENQKIEVSPEAARQLYSALGKKKEQTAQVVRGRNIQNQQIETRTLTAAEMEKLSQFFREKLGRELQPLISMPLFAAANPSHWVIVGDAFLNYSVQELYQAETLFLHSEFDVIQGVQWLS